MFLLSTLLLLLLSVSGFAPPSFIPRTVQSTTHSTAPYTTRLLSDPVDAPKKRGRPAGTKNPPKAPPTPVAKPAPLPLSDADRERMEYEMWLDLYMTDGEDNPHEFNSYDWSQLATDTDPRQRGVLVIETPELTAGSDDEIDVERIRGAVAKNFEGVVKIDHRVRGLLEDKIFEIRFEGYELEVLFSRRAAFFDRDAAHKGFAKKDVTDAEIERMMDSVRFAVSDEARDAYQF